MNSEEKLWGDTISRRTRGIPFLVYTPRPTSLLDIFGTAEQWSTRIYLVQDGTAMSFAETVLAARHVAASLRSAGVEPGDRVILIGANSIRWVIEFWAISQVGAVVVLGNPSWSAVEVQHALELTTPSLLLVESPVLRGQPVACRQLTFDELTTTSKAPTEPEGGRPSPPVEEDDPAVILFTSGSTGLPKGTTLSHRACIALQQTLLHRTNRLPHQLPDDFGRDVNLQTGPLFHIGGVQALLRSWILGATLVFLRDRFNPAEVLDVIEAEGIQRWGGVPTMITRVLDTPGIEDRDLSSVRSFTVGGTVVSEELIQRIKRSFPNAQRGVSQIYGLSEAGGTLTLASGTDLSERPGTVGRPLPVVELRILEPNADGVGEIVARTPSQMSGYWGQPDDGTIDDDGWLRTGDLGRLDQDGYLFVTGRSKDVIIRGGENIAAANVECQLLRHESVLEAAVVGLPDDDLGELVAAVVLLKPGHIVTEEQLREHVGNRLAYYEVPARWWFRTEQLPVNAAGKVDKPLLRQQLEGSMKR